MTSTVTTAEPSHRPVFQMPGLHLVRCLSRRSVPILGSANGLIFSSCYPSTRLSKSKTDLRVRQQPTISLSAPCSAFRPHLASAPPRPWGPSLWSDSAQCCPQSRGIRDETLLKRGDTGTPHVLFCSPPLPGLTLHVPSIFALPLCVSEHLSSLRATCLLLAPPSSLCLSFVRPVF